MDAVTSDNKLTIETIFGQVEVSRATQPTDNHQWMVCLITSHGKVTISLGLLGLGSISFNGEIPEGERYATALAITEVLIHRDQLPSDLRQLIRQSRRAVYDQVLAGGVTVSPRLRAGKDLILDMVTFALAGGDLSYIRPQLDGLAICYEPTEMLHVSRSYIIKIYDRISGVWVERRAFYRDEPLAQYISHRCFYPVVDIDRVRLGNMAQAALSMVKDTELI
ncbi:hypothetical protein HGA91_00215 [candidate division WWE3 bacterium]|nr:hypothetical protein [candidate division WWE3 bacterium]